MFTSQGLWTGTVDISATQYIDVKTAIFFKFSIDTLILDCFPV